MRIKPFYSALLSYAMFFMLFMVGLQSQAQDADRFQKEIDQITQENADAPRNGNLIVFTGSSSIRMWKDLATYFPEHQIINAGFGGSQTFELLRNVDELVINYQPKKVFIYEGDNDISAGKSTVQILVTMHDLVKKIKSALPDVEIMLIAAKPSISRWHLKDKYIHLNQHFEEYSQLTENVQYVDIWNPMLDETGKPKATIFMEDKLHMNKAGYDIWAEVIGKYLD